MHSLQDNVVSTIVKSIDSLIDALSKPKSNIITDNDSKQPDNQETLRITPAILNKCMDFKKYGNKQKYPYIRILPTTKPSKEFIAFDNRSMRDKRNIAKTYKSNPSSLFTSMSGFTDLIRPALMTNPIVDTINCKCNEYTQIPNTKCYWIEYNGSSLSNGVILVFHGAAYCIDIANHVFAECEMLSRLTGCICLVIQYKKAPKYPISNPQITEGLNVYQHFLLQKKIPPQKIVFMGDSSGGGLVLLILQRLGKTHRHSLPKCAILTSPWCHLQYDAEDEICKERKNYAYDSWLSYWTLHLTAKCALGEMDEGLNTIDGKRKELRTYNAVYGEFKALQSVSMYFMVGATEALLCDTLDAADKAYNAGCDKLKCDIYPYMFHSWHIHIGKFKEAEFAVVRWADFILENIGDNNVGFIVDDNDVKDDNGGDEEETDKDDFVSCKYEPDPGQVISV